MPKKLKIVLQTGTGLIAGLAMGYALLLLFNIVIAPLNLFLMSGPAEHWTKTQEIIAYAMGTIGWLLIIASTLFGGWVGLYSGLKNQSFKDFIKNLMRKDKNS